MMPRAGTHAIRQATAVATAAWMRPAKAAAALPRSAAVGAPVSCRRLGAVRCAATSSSASMASSAAATPSPAAPHAAQAASASASGSAARPAASAAASSAVSKQDMYRSPLRDADDRTYAHLWENAWVLDAPGQAHTIIWLHGLGQDTSSLHTMADILSPPRTKFVVPQAPKMPITALPDAPEQRNWFDIIVEHRDAIKEKEGEMMEEDEVGIEEMAKRVHELIEHEMRVSKLPAHRILLAGFGEGGALALHAALTFPQRLAGAVSLAGYLPLPHLYPECISPAARGTDAAGSKKPLPVLCVHGNSDFVVPLSFASARYALLRQAGLSVELRTEWSMGHFLSNSSLMATQGWMTDALNKAQQEEEQQQQQQQVQQQQQQQQQQPL